MSSQRYLAPATPTLMNHTHFNEPHPHFTIINTCGFLHNEHPIVQHWKYIWGEEVLHPPVDETLPTCSIIYDGTKCTS